MPTCNVLSSIAKRPAGGDWRFLCPASISRQAAGKVMLLSGESCSAIGSFKKQSPSMSTAVFFGVELAANLSMFRVSSRFIHFVVLAQLHKGSVTCSLPPKALKRGQPKACKATLEEHAGTPFGPERARPDQEVASGEAPEPAACQDCHPPTSESASSSYPRTSNLKDFEIESRKGYKLFVFY